MAALSRKHLTDDGNQVELLCYPDTAGGAAWLWGEVLPKADPILDQVAADNRAFFAQRADGFVETYATTTTPGVVDGRVLRFERIPGGFLPLEQAPGAFAHAYYCALEAAAVLIRLLYPSDLGPVSGGNESTLQVCMSALEAEIPVRALVDGRDLPVQPTIQDLERYAPHWTPLVSDVQDGVRAALGLELTGQTVGCVTFDLDQVRAQVEETYDCEVGAVLFHSDEMMTLASEGIFSLRYPLRYVACAVVVTDVKSNTGSLLGYALASAR
jgi:hypothetical protein